MSFYSTRIILLKQDVNQLNYTSHFIFEHSKVEADKKIESKWNVCSNYAPESILSVEEGESHHLRKAPRRGARRNNNASAAFNCKYAAVEPSSWPECLSPCTAKKGERFAKYMCKLPLAPDPRVFVLYFAFYFTLGMRLRSPVEYPARVDPKFKRSSVRQTAETDWLRRPGWFIALALWESKLLKTIKFILLFAILPTPPRWLDFGRASVKIN